MSNLGYGLPKTERIRRRLDYLRIQRAGRRLSSPSLLAFCCCVGSGAPRLGITVSRRVGGAVVRNRVKRLLREAFRISKHHFPPGLELVLVAKGDAARLAYSQVCAELSDLRRKIGSGVQKGVGSGG